MWHTLAACNACGKQQHVNEDEKKNQKEMKNAGIVEFSQLSKKWEEKQPKLMIAKKLAEK